MSLSISAATMTSSTQSQHITHTYTVCTFTKEGYAPKSTVTVESTRNYRYDTIAVHVNLDASLYCSGGRAECDSFAIEPNPDISGIGVLASFSISAVTIFILISLAYACCLLPESLINRADRQLFLRTSKNSHSYWRKVVEEITLIFSDQQLITGLGILIAGYVQVFVYGLDYVHWKTVTYLAWLSFTVHLMSLSILRERLNQNTTTRNIRVFAIFLVFGLLAAALSPTATYGSVLTPARCFFDYRKQSNIRNHPIDPDMAIQYGTLAGAFAWKLSQLFPTTRSLVGFWGRAKIESFFEATLRRLLRHMSQGRFFCLFSRILVFPYVLYVMVMDFFHSFAATLILLLFTLLLGGFKLFFNNGNYTLLETDIKAAEMEMTFGQILACLLLLQPCLAVVSLIIDRPKTKENQRVLMPPQPSTDLNVAEIHSHALSDIFRNPNIHLLTAEEKLAAGMSDAVIEHIYKSIMFRLVSYTWYIGVAGFLAGYIVLGNTLASLYYVSLLGLAPFLGLITIFLLCSSRLC